MIHLIKNYYADPNNMGFTLVIDKGRKDKDGKALYDTVGYCGSFEEVICLLKRKVVNDRLKTELISDFIHWGGSRLYGDNRNTV